MKNIKRHQNFINLKHKINSCVKLEKLESMSEVVLRYGKFNEDGSELMILFLQKRDELNPDYIENETLTDIHGATCGAK